MQRLEGRDGGQGQQRVGAGGGCGPNQDEIRDQAG